MPSIQSRIMEAIIRRAQLFGDETMSIDRVRERMERRARLQPMLSRTSIEKVEAHGVPAEWIVPEGAREDRAILYIHGGGFVICSPNTHRPMVSRIARAADIRALMIDYRLAPEHPYPAALDDCLNAFRWLVETGIEPRRLVVAGDSAGGNLALALVLALKSGGTPTDQLPGAVFCLSPVTDMMATGNSFLTNADADPMLSPTRSPHFTDLYIGRSDRRDPFLSPLYGDFDGFPPLLVHVGDREILLDDSVRLVQKALDSGVDARIRVWPGMYHVFQAFAPFVPESREAIAEIGRFISNRLNVH
jgi:acetyl esterase/lipase